MVVSVMSETEELVERYWVDSPKAFVQRMREIVDLHPDEIEAFEVCRDGLGQSIPGFRMGRGSKHVFLLGRMHGHEAVGTCGLAALVEGLADARDLNLGTPFNEAHEILERLRLHIFPLLNPDAAARASRQIRNSYLPSQFRYSQEDFAKYMAIRNEPSLTLKKERPSHFLPEELEVWRNTGKPMGTLYTEDGVEIWMDWDYERAPQTKAIRKLMYLSKPCLFIDVHSWEEPTMLWMPAGLSDAKKKLHNRLGTLFYDALEESHIPFDPNREIRVEELGGQWSHIYAGSEAPKGLPPIQWVYESFGASSFVYDVDSGYRWYDTTQPQVNLPTVSKAQIILTVWCGITSMLGGLLRETLVGD